MAYEDFCDELLNELEQNTGKLIYDKVLFYPDGFTSEDSEELNTIRNTNIRYHKMESDVLVGDFIILALENAHKQICRFSCSMLYEMFRQNGWDAVWEIINSNLDACEKYDKLDIMELLDKNEYEALREKLFIRPLNFNDHRYELKENVYRRIGDIVLVLYVLASDEREADVHNVLSMKLPKTVIESWNMDTDDVWDNAMTNTYIMSPPRIYLKSIDTYKPPYHRGAFMALNSDITSLPAASIPTLTTTTQMNGAIALFYPDVKERIAELFGDDYYVAFTSIHDVKLHKKGSISPRQILRSLKDINAKFDPAETLSRKVYIYERATGILKQLEL